MDKVITLDNVRTILPILKDNIVQETSEIILEKERQLIEPHDDDVPSVFITGDIPYSKDFVDGELEYRSKTNSFKAYTKIKLQGNSSLQYPKKNFTINLFSDANRTIKLNKNFRNWGPHNDFVLKADFIDFLRARNVVCAKLWSDIVKSRADYDTLPADLRNSPNNGAIDGFPIKVYVDGQYAGLYNWTIPKTDWMFGMKKGTDYQAVLCAEVNDNGDPQYEFNPCNFNATWSGVDGDYWSIEVGNNSYIPTSVNNLINCVRNENFEALPIYLDIDSAIDYFIFQSLILGIDGLAKNMLLLTYDMEKYYLGAYDLDSTFGIDWHGEIIDYDSIPPAEPYLNEYSKLFEVITNHYKDRFITRYWELREGALSNASIIYAFDSYINKYGEDLCIKDLKIWEIPSADINTVDNLLQVIGLRCEVIDEWVYDMEWE